jgi:hypothetical protein
MNKKKLRQTRLLVFLWMLLALAVITAATYAWFTFNPYTNVEPMSSTISDGEASLLISNSENGEFDVSCSLQPESNPDTLSPVSTSDLGSFFSATAQNQNGISILYEDVTSGLSEKAIHGTVYLKSENGSCDVYLYRTGMDFGSDAQALASLRLGLKITAKSGTSTYLFRLDEMGTTSSASTTTTVPTSGTVVSTVGTSGTAEYVNDPSVDFTDYFAVEDSSDDTKPKAGTTNLTSLEQDEVASVEYWLYLEGCDDNCINDVQNKDVSLQLAFAGVTREDT